MKLVGSGSPEATPSGKRSRRSFHLVCEARAAPPHASDAPIAAARWMKSRRLSATRCSCTSGCVSFILVSLGFARRIAVRSVPRHVAGPGAYVAQRSLGPVIGTDVCAKRQRSMSLRATSPAMSRRPHIQGGCNAPESSATPPTERPRRPVANSRPCDMHLSYISARCDPRAAQPLAW